MTQDEGAAGHDVVRGPSLDLSLGRPIDMPSNS